MLFRFARELFVDIIIIIIIAKRCDDIPSSLLYTHMHIYREKVQTSTAFTRAHTLTLKLTKRNLTERVCACVSSLTD